MRSNEIKSFAVSNRAAFVFPHVVAKSLFVEIPEKMERFDADVSSLESTLQETPEVFKGVCVDRTTDVLYGMVDCLMNVVPVESLVREKRVGIDDTASVNVLTDLALQMRLADVGSNQSTDYAATLNHSENGSLVAGAVHGNSTLTDFFVHIPRTTADVGFVYFDFAARTAKLHEGIGLHGKTDSMKHEPSGLLCDADSSVNLIGANAVFAVGDHPDCDKPLVERKRRILKDCPDLDGELLAGVTGLAFPHAPGRDEANVFASASGAFDAIGPTALDHKLEAVVGVCEEGDGLLECVWLWHLGYPHRPRVALTGY